MSLQVGDLTKQFPRTSKKGLEWQCLCRCGNIKFIREESLRKGVSTSCGFCGYGIKYPAAYSSWLNMRQRCTNPNNTNYSNYGGRGITICKEWDKFINFFEDMGSPPTDSVTGESYSLDREENDKGYYKANCRWASRITQNNNKSNNADHSSGRYSTLLKRKL